MISTDENFEEKQNEKIWMPKVIITQSPLVVSTLGKDVCPDNIKIPEINSWAQKYNEIVDIIGVEITTDSIYFFIPRRTTYSSAYNTGKMLLHKLIQRFPGLDGYSAPCEIPPLPSESDLVYELRTLDNNSYFKPISHPKGKINLVEKFLLSTNKEGLKIRLIILFQYSNNSKVNLNEVNSNLKIIFIKEAPKSKLSNNISHFNENDYEFLYSLVNDPQIGNTNKISLRGLYGNDLKEKWKQIWSSFTFQKKKDINYNVNASNFDFSFPYLIKNLNQSFYFPNENQMVLSKSHEENDNLILGHILNNSATTKRFGICPIDLLRRNMGIFGITGTGKTYLNLQIISELNKKRPKTGVLILSLAKKNQDILYRDLVDVVCIYGENDFSIPYLVFNEDIDPNSENIPPSSTMPLQATAQLLMACLDLKDPYINVTSTILKESYENHTLPEELDELFDKIPESITKYGQELNKNMTGIFNNRRGILQDELLLKTTKFLNGKVPDWFNWWLQGKSVFLDLSTCANNYVKSLLVFLILNMICIRAKELPIGVDEVKSVVFIDEAHRVLSKPRNNSDSANEEMKSEILGRILTENRSKGISIVISDQQPTSLLDVTNQSIGTRINFNLNENATNFFYNKSIEREIMKQLSRRKAHVKFENKSFFIQTLDLTENKLFHRKKNVVSNPSENWYISQILRYPLYVNKNIATKKITVCLQSYFRLLISRKKFLHATFIAYGLWNNIYRYLIFKRFKERMKSYYGRINPLINTIEEIKPIFREILHDAQVNNQSLNITQYPLKKKDVLLFNKNLMEFIKKIQNMHGDHELLDSQQKGGK